MDLLSVVFVKIFNGGIDVAPAFVLKNCFAIGSPSDKDATTLFVVSCFGIRSPIGFSDSVSALHDGMPPL